MKVYYELTMIDNNEIPQSDIMNVIFAKIHIAIVNAKNKYHTQYAISFPRYNDKNIGNKIRIFANTKDELQLLNINFFLNRMKDYVHISSIKNIPDNTKYAIYSIVHKDGSKLCLAKRYAKRHNITINEALKRYDLFKQRDINYRFIILKSRSTKQRFSLFIKKTFIKEKMNEFNNKFIFNSYGCSKLSAVPEF